MGGPGRLTWESRAGGKGTRSFPGHKPTTTSEESMAEMGTKMVDKIGAMQDFALTLDKFLEHAARWHRNVEVVTGRDGGRVDRVTYADLERRSHKVSLVFEGFGVGQGDYVATLAWNTQAHVEVWYAIMGIGAVCHTLNPRLTCAHLTAMVVQSEARILVASADLEPHHSAPRVPANRHPPHPALELCRV